MRIRTRLPGRLRAHRSLVAAFLLGLAAIAAAPASGAKLLAVNGDMPRFDRLTGQDSDGRMNFLPWDMGQWWSTRDPSFFDNFGSRPIVSLTMGKGGHEYLTPRQVARGRGDAHLVGVARAASNSGKNFFIRPYAEMNGHWNPYSAYNANGTRRDEAHSQGWFKQAFRRTYVIMHGGTAAEMSAKLGAIGLPGVSGNVPEMAVPRMTVIWNPIGYGIPDLRGNAAHAYWPGGKYVDMVANDIYSTGPKTWDANRALFNRYPNKPYAFGEWGLIGVDDPTRVRRVAEFARSHARVKLLVWYDGDRGEIYNLATKPKSLSAYKRYIVPLGR
jgi:hypothetical protein